MKKLIIFVLIGVAGWQIYNKYSVPVISHADLKLLNVTTEKVSDPLPSYESNYSCDGRQYCSQMNSRAEAMFFINNCPNTKMDGDHDGRPCESDSRF